MHNSLSRCKQKNLAAYQGFTSFLVLLNILLVVFLNLGINCCLRSFYLLYKTIRTICMLQGFTLMYGFMIEFFYNFWWANFSLLFHPAEFLWYNLYMKPSVAGRRKLLMKISRKSLCHLQCPIALEDMCSSQYIKITNRIRSLKYFSLQFL